MRVAVFLTFLSWCGSLCGIAAADPPKEVNYAPFAKQPEKAPVEVTDTDHEATRPRPGLGYFGRLDAPLGVPVHLVGMRVWFRRSVGLDASVGANVDTGDGPRRFAFGARVALPIALLVESHLTLFVAPTLAYAMTSETIEGTSSMNAITGLPYTPPDAHRRGHAFSGGARLGGELQLGAIGLARVALLASVGLDAHYVRGTTRAAGPPTTRDPEPRASETSSNRLAIETSFLTNLGVIFYF
jgi:hypothetical protein